MTRNVASAQHGVWYGLIGLLLLLGLFAIVYLAWLRLPPAGGGVPVFAKPHPDLPQWLQPPDGLTAAPNGKSLVFVGNHYNDSSRELVNDLWRLDLQTNKVSRLTNSAKAKTMPCFSPDGQWIVYVQTDQLHGDDNSNTVYMIPAEGGTPRLMTDPTIRLNFYRPTVSPDGKQIVVGARLYTGYDRDPYAGNKGSHLYLIPTDSTKRTMRLATPILFDSYIHGEFYDANTVVLERFDMGKTDPRNLLTIPDMTHLVESLDLTTGAIRSMPRLPGDTLLLTATVPGGQILIGNGMTDPSPYHIYILDSVHASTPRPLPDMPEDAIAFSGVAGKKPEETMLYFLRGGSGTGTTGVWRAPLSGGTPEQVADISLMDDPLNWKPATAKP